MQRVASPMNSSNLFIRTAALAAASLLFVSLSAAAQGFKWWQSDDYIREMGLTAEQSKRAEDIFQKALPKLKLQKTTLDEAEARFERLIERGDDSAVMEQVNVVETARAELNKTRTLMLLDMRKVLTRDQWAKFTALHQAAERAKTAPAKGAKATPDKGK